jgi:NAD(P)-dependent dehydrogenase (short-subunit alcohol dehydrogenase family)
MKINGKVIVITGGASGIGAAAAEYFQKTGAKVVIVDLSCKTVAGVSYCCDVTDAKTAEATVQKILADMGEIHVLINCAGILLAKRMVGRDGAMDLAEFSKIINVNLIGSFNMMRLAAAAMSTNKVQADDERGVIINTASIAAYDGQIGQVAYAASKGGIVSMTLPAARELARFGIRVMTIAPGLVATPMLFGLSENTQQSLADAVPFPRRLAKPSEYAQLAQQIIENVMLNGDVIRLDGAIRLSPK